MNRLWKRGISLFLAIVMVVSLLPTTAMAAVNGATDSSGNPYTITVGPGDAAKISEKELYDFLASLYGEPYEGLTNGGFRYTGGENSQKGIRASKVSDAEGTAGLTTDIEYSVETAYRSGLSVKWTSETVPFVVVESASKDTVALRIPNGEDGTYEVSVNMTTYAGLRESIVEAVVESINDGAVAVENAVITFHHKLSPSLTNWSGTDEYLVLNNDTLDEFIESEDKSTFRIGYGNADAQEVTIYLTDTLTASTIVAQGGNVGYYNGMSGVQVKQNIFDVIYDSTASTPADLTAEDVKIEVKSLLVWYDVASDSGLGVLNTSLGLGGLTGSSVTVRMVYSGNDTYAGSTSNEVSVKMVDPRADIEITANDTATIGYAETGMLDALKAALQAEPAAVKYYHGSTELTDAVLYEAAGMNPTGIEVKLTFGGDETYKPAEDKTVMVSFTNVSYSVPVTGGTVNGGETALDVAYGETIDITVDEAEGFNYSLAAGNAVLTKNEDGTYTLSEVKYNTTLTVTATIKSYTVTYTDGVEDKEIFADQTEAVEHGSAAIGYAATRDFYTLTGWTQDGNAYDLATPVSGPIQLAAVWAPINDADGDGIADEEDEFTVTWLDWDGSLLTTTEVLYGTAAVYPNDDPTRPEEGDKAYFFEQWILTEGEVDENGNILGAVTYTADYSEDTIYKVSFVTNNDQIIDPIRVNVTNNETVTEPTTELIRENYRFDGWYSDESCTVAYEFGNVPTESITLYAKWVQQVTVTFSTNGAPAIPAQTFDVNGKASEPAAPEKAQAIFNGWYLDGEAYDFDAAVTKSITLSARWIADTNENGVDDLLETITVVLNKANDSDKVTVNGHNISEENNTYVYDSVTGEGITLIATPVVEGGRSATYVASVTGATGDGAYNANYAYTISFTAEGTQEIAVNFAEAKFTPDEDGELAHLPGLETANAKDVYEAVVTEPAYEDGTVDIKYLAREAGSYQVWIPVLIEDVPIIGDIGGQYIDVPLEERWVSVDQTFTDVNPEAIVAEKIESIRALISEGGLTNYLKAAGEVAALATSLGPALNDYKCHVFGTADTEKLQITYTDEQKSIYDETLTVNIYDDRETTSIVANNISVYYSDFNVETLKEQIGAYVADANGNPIESEAALSYDGFLPIKNVGEYTVTISFPGDLTYKPAGTAAEPFSVTVTVEKSPLSIEVPKLNVTYGDDYSAAPVFTNNSGKVVTDVESVKFVVGLDANELSVNEEGMHGLSARVQLMIPDSIQQILNLIGLKEGMSLSTSELSKYLESASGALESLGLTQEAVEFLINALNTIEGINEFVSIDIVIGGSYPTDIGVYLMGAVSTDTNFETAFGIGYMVIKTDAQRSYLGWDHTDANGIWTWELLRQVSIGATAYTDEALTIKNEAATELVQTIFFGLNEDQELVFSFNEIAEPEQLGNGAFLQMAFIADFDNQSSYAIPIIRPMVIVPGITRVDINGVDENNFASFEFDNQPHALDVIVLDGDDNVVADTANGIYNDGLTVTYTGIQSNLKTYRSTEAPVHAGAYVVDATYTARNEQGKLVTFGTDIATMVIKAAESDITVDRQIIPYDGEKHSSNAMVAAASAVEGMTPDTTVITAAVKTDGSFSENYFDAIEGKLNVDLPAWVDELLADHADIADGINTAEFIATMKDMEAMLAEKEIETAFFSELISALAEMPEDLEVTFEDDVQFHAVGMYLVIGIITDSDHIPAMDAGYLVIAPEFVESELKFNNNDENGIFTRELMKHFDFTATAYGTEDGEVMDTATQKIQYLYFGIDANGNLVMTSGAESARELPFGAYTQIAYIAAIDSVNYIAKPIARPIVHVPNTVNVDFADVTATYIGSPIGISEVTVTNNEGEVIEQAEGALKTYYAGATNLAQPYWSEAAPIHVGEYTVFAIYTDNENVGAGVGKLTIQPAEATIEVPMQAVKYGTDYEIPVTVTPADEKVDPTDAKYLLITAGTDTVESGGKLTLSSINTINLDFPTAVDQILAELGIADGITVGNFSALAEKVQAALDRICYEGGYMNRLVAMLDQLGDGVTVTFEDNYKPTNIGVYLLVTAIFDPDYLPAADTGLLVIYPDIDLVDIDFTTLIPGELNIMPYNTVVDFDFSAHTDAGEEADSLLRNVIFGLTTDGKLFISDGNAADYAGNPTELGVYNQAAYLPYDSNFIDANKAYIAIPEFRSFTVVKCDYDVIFVEDASAENLVENNDRRFTYDGTAHEMPAVIVDAQGNPLGYEPTVYYMGIDTTLNATWSTTAPTNAGIYRTVAYYFDEDANIYVMTTGIMAIEKADAAFALEDTTVTYNGEEQFVSVTNPYNTDAIYVILDRENNVANVLLEDDLNALHAAINHALGHSGNQLPEVVTVPVGDFKAALEEMIGKADSAIELLPGCSQQYAEEVLDNISEILSKLPGNFDVTINGAKPVDVGIYEVYAVGYSPNYSGINGSAILEILKKAATITVGDLTIYEIDTLDLSKVTVSCEGFLDSDEITVALSCEGKNGDAIVANVTGEKLDNYDITIVNGTLTLLKMPITGITVTDIDAPTFGAVPDDTASVVEDGVIMKEFVWNPAEDTFTSGKSYGVTLILEAADGYIFNEDIPATVNGNIASVEYNEDGTLTVTYVFAAIPRTLKAITILGNTASYIPGSVALSATGTYDNGDVEAINPTWSIEPAYEGVSMDGSTVIISDEAVPGTATVKAELSGVTAEHAIKLSFKAPHELIGSTDPIIVTYGEAVTGNIFTCETGTVTYRSSNEDVVTVDENGNLTVIGTGEATITATVAEGTDNAETSVSYTVTILQAELTITGLAATNRIYNSTTAVEITGGTLNGVVDGDDVSVVMPTEGTAADKNVGADKAVALTMPTLMGKDADNYKLVSMNEVTVDIAKATITLSDVAAADRIYNGKADVELSYSVNGIVDGDDVTVTVTAAADNANAGADKAVTVTAALSGEDKDNYEIAPVTGVTVDIAKATITLSGVEAADRIYNGKADVELSYSVNGIVDGDDVTVTVTAAADNANAGSDKAVAVTAALSGEDKDNYEIAPVTGVTVDIAKATITLSDVEAADRIYNGKADVELSYTVNGIVDGDDVTVTVTAAADNANAGSDKAVNIDAVLSGEDKDNYEIAPVTGVTVDIAKATITLSDVAAADRIYNGEADVELSYSVNGIVDGDDVTVTVTAAADNANAGADKAVTVTAALSGEDKDNYEIAPVTGVTVDIAKATITLSDVAAADRIYNGEADVELSYSVNGVVDGDDVTVTVTAAADNANAGSDKAVAVTAALSGEDKDNYEIAPVTGVTVDIAKATIALSGVEAADRIYNGKADVELSYTVNGIVDGDDVTVTVTAAADNANAGSDKAVNVNAVLSGEDKDNYEIAPVTGVTVDIAKATISLSGIEAADRIYNGKADIELSYTVNGIVDGDDVTVSVTAAADNANAGSDKAVNINAVLSGEDKDNYEIAPVTGVTVDIAKATISLSGIEAADRIYNGKADVELSYTVNGIVDGDDVTVTVTAAADNANAGADKAVTVTAALSGEDKDNYEIAPITGVTVDIAKATITVNVSDIADTTYTGSQIKPTVIVTSDDKTLVLGTDYTVEYGENTNVGTGTVTIKPVTGSNYTFEEITKEFTIAALATQVTISGKLDVTYGTVVPDVSVSNPAATVYYYTNAACTEGETTVKPTNAGTYWVKAKLAADGNYSAAESNVLSFTISKAAQAIEGESFSLNAGTTVDLSTKFIALGAMSYAIVGEDATGSAVSGSTLNAGVLAGTFQLKVTAAATANYEAAELTVQVTVIVPEKEAQSINAADTLTFTYGDADQTVTATAIGEISYAVTSGDCVEIDPVTGALSIKKVGTAVITVTAAETDTHAAATRDITVIVNPKSITVTVSDIDDAAHTGEQIKPTVTVTDSDGNALTEGVDYTVVYGENTEPGTGTVTIKPIDRSNYIFDEVTKEFAIVEGDDDHDCDAGENCPARIFEDMRQILDANPTYWAHKPIDYVIVNGLMNGTGSNFEPTTVTSRAMIVTTLYRLEGSPAIDGETIFADVLNDSWYTDAIIWATQNDIVLGYGNGNFGPEDYVTREQIGTILYRYAKYKGMDTTISADLSDYSDATMVHDWALDALKWSNAVGLMKGRTKATMNPLENCTRAELATLLMRWCEDIAE